MFFKPLPEIILSDLELLVSNKVNEGIQIDFKVALSDRSDEGKRDFLKDICSFANTNGGFLLYGVKEEEGIAKEIVGIENLNFNDLKLWMENLIRTSIEPRLTGLEFTSVPVSESKSVFIVKVPRSWSLPHVANFGKLWRFYGRNSAGNFPMDVTQLRDLFILGDTILKKLEERRAERLATIQRDRQISPVKPFRGLIIHIQPFDSLKPENLVDLSRVRTNSINLTLANEKKVEPIFNFDGLFFCDNSNYLQIYHSGMTEEMSTGIFDKNEKGENFINTQYLEWDLIKGVGQRLALLKSFGVMSPLLIQISLLGVADFKLRTRYKFNEAIYSLLLPQVVDRADLVVKPIFIESVSALELEGSSKEGNSEVFNCWKTAEGILKPALDSIWNAFGMERCFHYHQSEYKGYMSSSEAYRFRTY